MNATIFSVGLIFLTAVTFAPVTAGNQDNVSIFTGPKFQGRATAIKVTSKCTTFGTDWNNKIGSIAVKKDSCVRLYDKENCDGIPLTLKQFSFGTNDLNDVDMKEIVSSIKLC